MHNIQNPCVSSVEGVKINKLFAFFLKIIPVIFQTGDGVCEIFHMYILYISFVY